MKVYCQTAPNLKLLSPFRGSKVPEIIRKPFQKALLSPKRCNSCSHMFTIPSSASLLRAVHQLVKKHSCLCIDSENIAAVSVYPDTTKQTVRCETSWANFARSHTCMGKAGLERRLAVGRFHHPWDIMYSSTQRGSPETGRYYSSA